MALVASQLLPSLEGRGGFIWSPEFGDYMLEGLPSEPFGSELNQLLRVEEFLKSRSVTIALVCCCCYCCCLDVSVCLMLYQLSILTSSH